MHAIDVYLRAAYGTTAPPSAVKSRIETLRATGEAELYDSPAFERDTATPPARFAVRLGNPFYPHMKLVIERSPDGHGHLLRADTHDRHVRPAPGSKEFDLFRALMEKNQKVAEQIETAWAQAGLPTFKEYLRRDLAQRAAQVNPTHVQEML